VIKYCLPVKKSLGEWRRGGHDAHISHPQQLIMPLPTLKLNIIDKMDYSELKLCMLYVVR